MAAKAHLRVFRGDKEKGELRDYEVETYPGMVVLDAIHDIQAREAPDLGVRWNCKAGRCGSCGAEVNGKPRLMCMTRMTKYPEGEPITVTPMKSFPIIKDLVTDVSWNFEVAKKIPPFTPRPRDADGTWRMQQYDIDRIQEFRKCIECFLCQNVCHVIRDHEKKQVFAGPRFFIHLATLEMHPLDTLDRRELMKDEFGLGLCNITKCCTEVCPEQITITDNAIIPIKERVVDDHYDPVRWLLRKMGSAKDRGKTPAKLPEVAETKRK
jgi:succinate dehydrogenase / fumarate reductase, iron-sulfur subunit